MLHIITSFSRLDRKDWYINMLESKNIIWHPILHYNTDQTDPSDKFQPLTKKEDIEFNRLWIQPHFIKNIPSNIDICYYKLDDFIQNSQTIIDSDRYCFMNDDDWMEDDTFDFFNTTKLNEDVVFVSMKRGYGQQPGYPNGHPTSTLIAHPANMQVGTIGLEQYFVKGNILKQIRFDVHNGCTDGLIAVWLFQNFKVSFAPYRYVWFNYLEPGRWEK
jgi:hypothetical protein